MNREDIIRMAQEAGAMFEELPMMDGIVFSVDDREWNSQALERFFHMAQAAEREAIDNAYRERNQLVALLSTLFPSGKAKTAIEGWDEAWHGCVYIDFPWGQASWHYHSDDDWMFAHLPPYNKDWDGHTTEAKYAAIATAIRARGNE